MRVSQAVGHESDMKLARQYYLKAYELSGKDGLLVRAAILLPMVMSSMVDVMHAREFVERELDMLLARGIQ